MKLNRPVSSAFPTALAAASIVLALLMLPGGAAPVHPAGMAPALKLVAGDVVAAVENPVHVVTKAHPKPVASGAVGVAGTTVQRTQPSSSRSQARPAPAHRHAQHRARAPRPRVVKSAPVTAPATPAPAPISRTVGHGHGKAKAWGHLRKIASPATPGSAALHAAKEKSSVVKAHGRLANVPLSPTVGHSHGKAKAWGRLRKVAAQSAPVNAALHGVKVKTSVPHGPPAVPPGQDKTSQGGGGSAEHGASGDHGGGK